MIRFSKYIFIYALISGIIIIPGIYSLIRYGLKPSIDFAGGTLLEMKIKPGISQESIGKKAAENGLVVGSIQKSGADTIILRTKEEEDSKFLMLINSLNSGATDSAVIVRQETVGPLLGKELLMKAIVAAVLAIAVILLYVAYAFKNIRFGVAAILALVHDIIVMFGLFSIFGKIWGVEVDTLFVTAVLTTMSFSMHDTIVVFDRIREYRKKGLNLSFEQICDRALTETMGRSLTNSVTIILMLIALVLMGGSTVKWFTVALLIGTISGTYSSDFVATPIIILWQRWRKK